MYADVYSSNINNSYIMKTAQVSIDRRMDTEDVVYIYTIEYYSAHKKNEILPFATTWMEQENIMLSFENLKIYYMETMNHGTLLQKLMMHSMVTNIIK